MCIEKEFLAEESGLDDSVFSDSYDYDKSFKMIRKCMVCGHDFEDKSKYKPRQYCYGKCSDYMKQKNALENTLIAISPTPEAKKIIRGDMFRLSNLLSKRTVTNSRNKVDN
ncbi:MAG: hypothetical protein ACJAWW_001618 [Sulfurimonas sp.]|jgi:hypothetical protein